MYGPSAGAAVTSMRVSHFSQCCPSSPARPRAAGSHAPATSGSPFIAQASSTPRVAHVGDWQAADEDGLTGQRRPEPVQHHVGGSFEQARAIEQRVQPRARPSRLSHGRTPPGQPRAGGSKKRRPLPAHSRMSRRVSAGSDTTSAWSSVEGRPHQALHAQTP